MRFMISLATILVFSGLACGQTPKEPLRRGELKPMESALTGHTPEYYLKLRQLLFGRAPVRSDLHFLILPSFEPETLASVYKIGDGFEVQIAESEKDVWFHMGRVEEIGVKVSRKTLPAALAIRLKSLWTLMLLRTRYERSDVTVNDGVFYVFSATETGIGQMTGVTHSPAEGTRPCVLADIGKLLIAFVVAEPSREREVLSKMNELMDLLDAMLATASASESTKGTESRKK